MKCNRETMLLPNVGFVNFFLRGVSPAEDSGGQAALLASASTFGQSVGYHPQNAFSYSALSTGIRTGSRRKAPRWLHPSAATSPSAALRGHTHKPAYEVYLRGRSVCFSNQPTLGREPQYILADGMYFVMLPVGAVRLKTWKRQFSTSAT